MNNILFSFYVATLVGLVTAKFLPDSQFQPYLTTEDYNRADICSNQTDLSRSYIRNASNRTSLQNDIIEWDSRSFYIHRTWENARVPYTLSPTLTPEDRAQVAIAFEDYHSKTCIRFVAKQPEDVDYVELVRNDGEGVCGFATFCRVGGAQTAEFGNGCRDARTIIHELGHTLCYTHEMYRFDRDNYISYTDGCKDPLDDPATYSTYGLFYDYFSVMHYDACWPGACLQAKQNLPDEWCGNPGRLGVLDAEKFNAKYNCGGCYSLRFKPFVNITSGDNLVLGASNPGKDDLHICRMYVNGEIVVGKAVISKGYCWVAYGNTEVGAVSPLDFEVLTNPENVNLEWTMGSSFIPTGSVPGGRRTTTGEYLVLPETYYIGRCDYYKDSVFEAKIPGKVFGKTGKMMLSTGGRAHECNDYEILTCRKY